MGIVYTFSSREKALLATPQLKECGYKVREPELLNGVWKLEAKASYVPRKEKREKVRLERLELAPQDRLGVFFLRKRNP